MNEIIWDGKIIRYHGFKIENDFVVIPFGNRVIKIPLLEFKKLEKKEV